MELQNRLQMLLALECKRKVWCCKPECVKLTQWHSQRHDAHHLTYCVRSIIYISTCRKLEVIHLKIQFAIYLSCMLKASILSNQDNQNA
jgi:hypothetical protein